MERRVHKRIYINEKATIVIDDTPYNGYVVNMSEEGVSFTLSAPFSLQDDTVRNSLVGLTFKISGNESVTLKCDVVWIKKGLYTGSTIALGVKIVEPTIEYKNWINKLLASNSYINADSGILY